MRSVLLLLFTICLTGLASAQSLSELSSLEMVYPPPTGYSMQGFAETGPDTVIGVGLASTVLRSVDGGLNWTQIVFPTLVSPDLNDLEVLPDGTLVAAGQAPGVFISTDHGFNWFVPNLPVETDFIDVTLTPDGRVSVAGLDGTILLSSDHGITWENIGPGDRVIANHMWLTDDICFFLSGQGIERTIDAGQSWQLVLPLNSFGQGEVYQLTPTHLGMHYAFNYYESFDAGENWAVGPEFPIHYPFRSVILDGQHRIVSEFGESAEIHETFDDGQTWAHRMMHSAVGTCTLFRLASGRVLASSSDGLIFWSDDTFSTIHPAWSSVLVDKGTTQFTNIAERNDGVLFAAGSTLFGPYDMTWLRSEDRGDTWQELSGGPDLYMEHLELGGTQQGLAANNQEIRYSVDGGLSWTDSETENGLIIRDLAIASDDRSFATVNFSPSGKLISSSDGGATWQDVANGLPEGGFSYGQVAFLNSEEGWVVGLIGSNSITYKTSDGGDSWQEKEGNGLAGRPSCMVWLSSDIGYVGIRAGTGTMGVYGTEDGGDNWVRLTTNRTENLVLGMAGEILATGPYSTENLFSTDGGQTWDTVVSPFRSAFNISRRNTNSTVFLGDSWLMGGKAAQIFKLGVVAPSGVEIGGVPESSARLLTIAPNPFNPGTTISMTVPNTAEQLVLNIFDARGVLVRKLWSGASYSERLDVYWNGLDDQGNSVSSGIYFARMSGREFRSTGKMLLIK